MNEKGVLIILSGPSGSGKDTVLDCLTAKNDSFSVSISMTTRAIRENEIDGVNYYFTDRAFFEKQIKDNQMLEYAEYAGNYYGTPKAAVDRMLNEGKNVVLKIEVQGAAKIRRLYPDVISIFFMPPSMKILESRLRGRGTDDEETINHRLFIACEEIKRSNEYDYIVVNDEIENAVEKIETIIAAEKMKTVRNKNIISEVIKNV